ncbi:unnamed protein product [Cylicocyclus nassatus]|uniref:Uncharacterized protein n=1 Tax=Cylicocyclus nassatus TaxID=53992 RepID=A0AA36DM79_CYLNA|nr:unnamed protein product [Cylicocyclus nassatus]
MFILPRYNHTSPLRKGECWSRSEVQLVGLTAILFVMTVAFFGISILNWYAHMKHQQNSMRNHHHTVLHIFTPTFSRQHSAASVNKDEGGKYERFLSLRRSLVTLEFLIVDFFSEKIESAY